MYLWQIQSSTKKVTENNVSTSKESEVANDWQEYQNEQIGFHIKYPQDWVYEKYNNEVIYFGTPESKTGGYIWGIFIHQPNELEKVIAQMGDQFTDRKETREEVMVNNNITGTLVTVTTNKYPDWILKTVYFEKDGQLFAITNGAIDDDTFEAFYKSFEFTN